MNEIDDCEAVNALLAKAENCANEFMGLCAHYAAELVISQGLGTTDAVDEAMKVVSLISESKISKNMEGMLPTPDELAKHRRDIFTDIASGGAYAARPTPDELAKEIRRLRNERKQQK